VTSYIALIALFETEVRIGLRRRAIVALEADEIGTSKRYR
jgi:hypothetical protein